GPVVAACQDIIVLIPQWLIIILIIGAHYAIVFHLEVPGCPMGYLGPGGIQDNGDFRRCVGGATGYVDRMILGVNHMYQNPTENEVYKSGAFEPEGIVGCLLSVFQVFLGVQAGTTLTFYQEWKDRLKHWLAWGTASGIIGAILCLASKEEGWIPVNKNLWSLSFVLVTSSFAFFLLSACYFLIDVKFWWSGKPFFYPGMNATIMFVGHEVAYNLFPWHWSVGAMNTHFMQLIEALWGTGLKNKNKFEDKGEHLRNVKNGEVEKSAVAAHAWSEKYLIDTKASLIKQIEKQKELTVWGKIHIQK
ncbi:hypothetical protein L9F63_025533, partial [Diploptera punctata]